MVYGTTFVMLDATFIMGYSMLAIHAFKSSVGTKVNVSTLSGIGLMFVGTLLCWNGYTLAVGAQPRRPNLAKHRRQITAAAHAQIIPMRRQKLVRRNTPGSL